METEVVGRDAELEAIERWLEAPRPSAFLVEGEAGIGKTTLWRTGVERARDRNQLVLACAPSLAEADVGFAALGDLLGTLDGELLELLPSPQRLALEGALLLRDPERPPEGRALGLGLVGVLARLASETRVLVALDDTQWLDAASRGVLSFAARRLLEHDVGYLIARRTGEGGPAVPLELDRALPPGGLEVCALGPLSLGALGHLVRQRTGLSLRRPELLRLEALSGGNPFFAVELAPTLTGASSEQRPLPTSLSAAIQTRLAELGEDTLEALVVAAVSPSPTLTTIEQVTECPDAWLVIEPARHAAFVLVDGEELAFVHPLYPAAVLERASPKQRAEVHRRLAVLSETPELRARHLAASTQVADEEIAAAIEAGARDAMLRGAPEIGAELAGHARALTPDDDDARRRRGLLEAECLYAVGDLERGRELLGALAEDAPHGPARAEILFRLARSPRNYVDAIELCERGLAEALDEPALASEIALVLAEYLFLAGEGKRAITAARRAIELGAESGADVLEWRARSALAMMEGARGAGWDLDTMRRAADVELAASERPVVDGAAEWLCQALTYSRHYDEARDRVAELRSRAAATRDARADASFLALQCTLEIWSDRLHAARETSQECLQAKEVIGWEQGYGESLGELATLDAWLGNEADAREGAERALSITRAGSEQLGVIRYHQALLALELGLENWEAATEHAEAALAAQETMLADSNFLGFLSAAVEAHAALGTLDRAEELTQKLEAAAITDATAALRRAASQSRGVLRSATGDFEGAVESLESAVAEAAPGSLEHARALLHLGRAQRRGRRLAEARMTLTRARDLLDEIGASLLAGQARRELARISGRRAGATGDLTEAEQRIADLVAEGRSNKEVAAALVISVKTVEVTLTRVYRKLGVRSRSELARRSADAAKQ